MVSVFRGIDHLADVKPSLLILFLYNKNKALEIIKRVTGIMKLLGYRKPLNPDSTDFFSAAIKLNAYLDYCLSNNSKSIHLGKLKIIKHCGVYDKYIEKETRYEKSDFFPLYCKKKKKYNPECANCCDFKLNPYPKNYKSPICKFLTESKKSEIKSKRFKDSKKEKELRKFLMKRKKAEFLEETKNTLNKPKEVKSNKKRHKGVILTGIDAAAGI